MIEVEAEAADFDGLAATFVLARIDARVELMENLVVAREEGLLKDLGITAVDGGLDGGSRDHDGGVDLGQFLSRNWGE